MPKQLFEPKPKTGGGLGWGSNPEIMNPYLFLRQLKLWTSNVVYNLGVLE